MFTQEDELKMKELEQKVDRLNDLTQQLVYAITGSSSMGTKGLIDRVKDIENKTVVIKEELLAMEKFLYVMLDSAEGEFDRKFAKLNNTVELQLQGYELFRKEMVKFKSQLELYVGVFTNRTSWVFLFRLLGAALLISLIVIAWNKNGFDFIIDLLKRIF